MLQINPLASKLLCGTIGRMSETQGGKTILVYEPNAALAGTLAQVLVGAGFVPTTVTKIPTVLPSDTWLVAGGSDPLSHTALLRERLGGQAPIVHLLPVGEANNGAVHAIEKPFRLQDFVVQITRIINRPHDVTIGAHKLHVNVRQMEFADGRSVMLTEKEVGILLYLALARVPVARDVLLHEVWGYHPEATTHTLETHIYRLRQKIEKDPEKPAFLITTEAGYALA